MKTAQFYKALILSLFLIFPFQLSTAYADTIDKTSFLVTPDDDKMREVSVGDVSIFLDTDCAALAPSIRKESPYCKGNVLS